MLKNLKKDVISRNPRNVTGDLRRDDRPGLMRQVENNILEVAKNERNKKKFKRQS